MLDLAKKEEKIGRKKKLQTSAMQLNLKVMLDTFKAL